MHIMERLNQKGKKKKAGRSTAAGGEADDTGAGLGEDHQVSDLINRMLRAYEEDREANINGRPAIQRLMMAPEVYSLLRKHSI